MIQTWGFEFESEPIMDAVCQVRDSSTRTEILSVGLLFSSNTIEGVEGQW